MSEATGWDEGAREAAKKATREADRAEAEAWSIRMDGYGAFPNDRIPLEHIRRPGHAIWKLRSNADHAAHRSTRRRHT